MCDRVSDEKICPFMSKSELHSPMDCPNMELKWDDGGCYPRKDVKYCEHCSSELWVNE